MDSRRGGKDVTIKEGKLGRTPIPTDDGTMCGEGEFVGQQGPEPSGKQQKNTQNPGETQSAVSMVNIDIADKLGRKDREGNIKTCIPELPSQDKVHQRKRS